MTEVWAYIRRRPVRATFALGSLLIVLSMVLTYRYTAFLSDDVYWQNIWLQHWHPFGKDLLFGIDSESFLLQAPIYWFVSLFIAPGRHAMLVDGVLLALINFALFYASALYFLQVAGKKANYTTLLPIVWLASFGFGLSRLFLGTNLHTLVVGLIFVLLMLTSKTCRGEFSNMHGRKRWLLFASVVLLVSLSILNDKYFVYFGIVPAVALALVYFASKRMVLMRLLAILGTLAAGEVVYHAIVTLLPRIGVMLAPVLGTPTFISPTQIGPSLVLALHSFVAITGTDFLGQPVVSAAALGALVNAALIIIVIIGSIRLLKNKQSSPEEKVFAGLFWFVFLALALSTWNNFLWCYRYLVALPFVAAVLLMYLPAQRLSLAKVNLYRTLLVTATLLNLIVSVQGTATDKPAYLGEYSNAANFHLIDTLKKTGISKGYAEYWSAQINSYLAAGKLTIEPVACYRDGYTAPNIWFIDRNQYLAPSQKSFYVFDALNMPTCTRAQVRKQFGAPARILKSGSYTIYIYNYDLLNKMDQYWLRKSY